MKKITAKSEYLKLYYPFDLLSDVENLYAVDITEAHHTMNEKQGSFPGI